MAVVYRERIAGALKAEDRRMRPRILHGLAKGPSKSGESAARTTDVFAMEAK